MTSPDLEKFVNTAREQGITDKQIENQLLKSGWSKRDVLLALIPQPEKNLPQAPLPPVPHFNMWIAFQYIILFISLYISSFGLGGISHYAVDQIFPDKLENITFPSSFFADSLIKGYIAAMLVAFPIFAVLFLLLKKQEIEKPAVKNLKSRKVLIYFTLVVTFLIMIGNFISTIYRFLDGSMTSRTSAYVLVTLAIAGGIFLYYLWEVKNDHKTHD